MLAGEGRKELGFKLMLCCNPIVRKFEELEPHNFNGMCEPHPEPVPADRHPLDSTHSG
jgi:hypothetical protein